MYARELKISRLTYDEILAQNSAEWMFEYGMIKIRNHADGFSDSVVLSNEVAKTDTDTEMFRLKTPRSEWMEMDYKIVANSNNAQFSIGAEETLVIPLGIDEGQKIDPSKDSKKPAKNTSNIITSGNLNVSADKNEDISWTIAAMSWSINVALTGTGKIDPSKNGTMTLSQDFCVLVDVAANITSQWEATCNDALFQGVITTTPTDLNLKKYNYWWKEYFAEKTSYDYQVTWSVADFMSPWKKNFWEDESVTLDDWSTKPVERQQKNVEYKDFYLVLFNKNLGAQNVNISTNSEFSLPKYTITSTAKKWEASQVFEFAEDKSRIYDFLKFGYYDPTEIP